MLLSTMGKNIIVSEETVRDLLEAHASLSAWYYELSAALRAVHGAARSPDDQTRAAFVERLALDFPEVAAVARTIRVPRMFVPPPPAIPSRPLEDAAGDEQSTLIEPAQARARNSAASGPSDEAAAPPAPPARSAPPAPPAPVDAAAPPAPVDPSKVKY